MKKLVMAQIIAIALTILAGLILKGDLGSTIRLVHRLLAFVSMLVSMGVVLIAYRRKESRSVRSLTLVTLVLVGMAGIGGKLTQVSANYSLAFALMGGAAIAAIVMSFIVFKRLKVT